MDFAVSFLYIAVKIYMQWMLQIGIFIGDISGYDYFYFSDLFTDCLNYLEIVESVIVLCIVT